MVRVFANSPGFDPRFSRTKDSKMVLDASLLNNQHYKGQIKDKWSNPGKGVALSPTPRCSRSWKGSLRVALDYGQPTYIQGVSIYMGLMWLLITVRLLFFYFRVENNITIINLWSQCLGQERKNILRYYLFGDKIIQNYASKISPEVWLIPRKAKFIIGYINFKPLDQ